VLFGNFLDTIRAQALPQASSGHYNSPLGGAE
jgi:hypothetical protein